MNTNFVEITLTTVSKDLLEEVLDIYNTNAEYFKISSGKKPSIETIIEDKNELPPSLKMEDKNYKLIKKDGLNIGIVDYLEGYPAEDIVYIGLLMIHGDHHRQGYGRAFIDKFARDMKSKGYKILRLGVLKQNKKTFKFWTKMGFRSVKEVTSTIHPERNWEITVMEKVIWAIFTFINHLLFVGESRLLVQLYIDRRAYWYRVFIDYGIISQYLHTFFTS